MSRQLPFIVSGGDLTIFINGVPHAITTGHLNYATLTDMAQQGTLTDDNLSEILKLVSQREAIKEKLHTIGKVTVGQDAIFYNDTQIHSYLTSRMLEMADQGHDITPWARFMDKLYQNPSKTAVDELFLWLERANMPITTGGNFLAYKKVKDDFTSFYDGKTSNKIGETVEMARYEVDDNRNRTCSNGLHFCSWHYLPEYHGTRGKVVVVEINPADVVSIPSDYDNAKGRAWRYVVKNEIAQKDCQFAFANTPVVDDYDDTENDDWMD